MRFWKFLFFNTVVQILGLQFTVRNSIIWRFDLAIFSFVRFDVSLKMFWLFYATKYQNVFQHWNRLCTRSTVYEMDWVTDSTQYWTVCSASPLMSQNVVSFHNAIKGWCLKQHLKWNDSQSVKHFLTVLIFLNWLVPTCNLNAPFFQWRLNAPCQRNYVICFESQEQRP